MNSAIQNSQSTIDNLTDWLWYWLKRVPADEALRLAIESRLAGEPSPLQANRFPPPSAVEPAQILEAFAVRAIEQTEQVLLFLEMPEDGITQIYAGLSAGGWQIEQWQPYFDEAASAVSKAIGRGNADLWHTLTGHYVPLPWKRFLESAESHLRPYYEAPLTDQGQFVAVLASKSAVETVKALPPMGFGERLGSSRDGEYSRGHLASPPHRPQLQAPSPSTLLQSARPKILLALAIAFAFLAQLTMRSETPAIGQSITLWLIALAALFGVTVRKREGIIDSQRLWKFGGVAGAFLLSLFAETQSDKLLIALPLWLLGVGLATYSLWERPIVESATLSTDESTPNQRDKSRRYAVYGLLFTILLAFGLRAYRLTAHPWIIDGIEAQLGLDALAVRDLFGTAWLTNPSLPLFLQKGIIGIFGRTPLAIRLLSPFIGTACVVVGWWIGRKLWNEYVGLVAAMLIAFNHTLIHYSRLGTTNVYEPLLTLLAMGGIGAAWQQNSRRAWLGTGIAIGLSAYFFTTVHLLPIMLIIWLIVALLSGELHERWRGAMAMLMLAAVVALPQIRFYIQNPLLFWDRANVLGILQNGWLRNEVVNTNENVVVILARRFFTSAAGFNATITMDGSFDPGVPLVNAVVGVLFLLGLGMAIFHLRQMRYAVLLIGYGVTIVFGDALLIESPHSRRLLIALPLVLMLAARAFVWGMGKLELSSRSSQIAVVGFGMLMLVLGSVGYFGRYQSAHTFADPNSEAAYLTATYLSSLEGEWTAYLHGAPSLYTSFSTIPFLAENFQTGINLHDVEDSNNLPFPNSTNATHIFTANRLGDIALIQERFPKGQIESLNGFYGNPLIVVLEVTP